MDLEEELKAYPELHKSLEGVIESCKKTWQNPHLPWFTNHDVSHSQEIIHLLGEILSPLEDTPERLNEHELFVLLASAYLHDVGMQFLKVDNISIDKLTLEEYEQIRQRHANESFNIILKSVQDSLERDDFHLPDIKEDYLSVIAHVSKGHATDFFEETVGYFEKNPATPLNRPVRGGLLTSLLMIADELDLHNKRVDFNETAKFDLSDFSKVHWFKHHYVDFVGFNNGAVHITLKFPINAEDYSGLIKELIERKLQTQIEKVNPLLKNATAGKLHIDNIVQITTKVDDTGTKRKLPDGALKELMKMLKKEDLMTSSDGPEEVVSLNIPRASNIFTGRKEELEKFKDAIENANLVSIEGLGGIGKTEFAAKCIEFHSLEDKVVWFDCFAESKLDSLIGHCGYTYVLKGENKTERAKYSGFTDLIERDGKIIFLDNFQDVLDASFKDFFAFSERRLKKAKFVFISREHPQLGSLRVFPIGLEGLEKEDSIEYAKSVIKLFYHAVDISDEDLENVCKAVAGHPFAIDLSLQLLNYGEPPDNIVQKLLQERNRSEELSHRLLDEIFKHPKSTEEEKELLLTFSIFRDKVKQKALDYISDNPDRIAVLHTLIDKKMITCVGALYGCHPLVREFCYHRLKNNEKSHLKACEYLKSKRKETLDTLLEEEIFYHLLQAGQFREITTIISEKGEEFISLGHTNSLKEMMDKTIENGMEHAVFYLFNGNIAEIRGEWKNALKYFEQSFSFQGVEEKTSAMAYIKYGEILYRMGDVKASLKFFQDSYEICKKTHDQKGEARSINNIGLVNQTFENLEQSEKDIDNALNLSKIIHDNSGIATYLNNIGSILHTKGDLKGALKKYNGSLDIETEIGDKSGIAASLNNIGLILNAKGNLKGALEKYYDSLDIEKEIGNKFGIAASLNNIGSILDTQGNVKGALEKYNDSLDIQKEIGDKSGIATSFLNIGTLNFDNNDYFQALEYLFKANALKTQMGINEQTSINYIFKIRKTLGVKKFEVLAKGVFENLPKELQPFINLEEFIEDKTISAPHKPGRNVPCPCGSGKKYKKCCGR